MDSIEYKVRESSLGKEIGSFCRHVTGLCSEFEEHLAPTYRHDRCERTVHMRLYSLSKRQFVCVFFIFFVCFGISILIGSLGPPIITTDTLKASTLGNNKDKLQTGPFGLKSPIVSTFHQQLWLMATIQIAGKPRGHKLAVPVTFGVEMYGLTEDSERKVIYKGTHVVNSTRNTHNKSRELRCDGRTCEEIILLHLGYLDYTQYYIIISYYGIDKTIITGHINDTMFTFHTYNPSFTQTEIWFRFVFIIATFLFTVWFVHGMKKFSVRDWGMEQRWMSLLLPLLLLYNNPLFPLTFLVNSWVPGMIDAMFQAAFLCALLLFWLCLYHGVRQNSRHFCAFYLPKLVIVGLMWIAAVTLSSWQAYNELQDPTYNYKLDTGNYTGFKVFFFTIGGIYILYLIFLFVRAYAELRSMPYFDLRLKFMTALVVIVVSVSCAIMALRFGSGVLQDNFVAEISTHYKNSAEFLSFYGLLNFYLYTMAYVYSPSKNAARESHYRDNPALSMLNDSDEDIIHGSDEEISLTSRAGHHYHDNP